MSMMCDNISDGTRQCTSSNAAGFLPTSLNANSDSFVGLTRALPVFIPPEFNGPITTLNSNDVLCGKGKAINKNPANVKLRECILQNKARYLFEASKSEKACITDEVLAGIRCGNPPGRFLEKDKQRRFWIEIGDLRAREKIGQCFREKIYDKSSKVARQSASSNAPRALPSFIILTRVPPLFIPPEFNGPITTLNSNDVLCGRGKLIDSNPGNVKLRDFVLLNKTRYLFKATKIEKACIVAEMVACIRSQNPPGRFLKKAFDPSYWIEIGDQGARKKVGQRFREIKIEREKDTGAILVAN